MVVTVIAFIVFKVFLVVIIALIDREVRYVLWGKMEGKFAPG